MFGRACDVYNGGRWPPPKHTFNIPSIVLSSPTVIIQLFACTMRLLVPPVLLLAGLLGTASATLHWYNLGQEQKTCQYETLYYETTYNVTWQVTASDVHS